MFSFYPPRQATLPYSYGIDHAVLRIVQNIPEDQNINLALVAREAYSLVYVEAQVNKALPTLAGRVEERLRDLKSQVEQGQSKKGLGRFHGRGLGTAYADWISKLNSEESCLFLADNDPVKAHQYFWLTEMALVEMALKQKIAQTSQALIAQMEASLYGFGGKYTEDDGPSIEHDLTSGEGVDQLKQLGF